MLPPLSASVNSLMQRNNLQLCLRTHTGRRQPEGGGYSARGKAAVEEKLQDVIGESESNHNMSGRAANQH